MIITRLRRAASQAVARQRAKVQSRPRRRPSRKRRCASRIISERSKATATSPDGAKAKSSTQGEARIDFLYRQLEILSKPNLSNVKILYPDRKLRVIFYFGSVTEIKISRWGTGKMGQIDTVTEMEIKFAQVLISKISEQIFRIDFDGPLKGQMPSNLSAQLRILERVQQSGRLPQHLRHSAERLLRLRQANSHYIDRFAQARAR